MKRCSFCNSVIFAGGIKSDEGSFCSTSCQSRLPYLKLGNELPDDLVRESTLEVYESACPKCNEKKPVDIHYSYSIKSALVMTTWKSTPHICCNDCGTKFKLKSIFTSLLYGWWSIPWGFIMTPVQIGRNLLSIKAFRSKFIPSQQLTQLVRVHLARKLSEENVSFQETDNDIENVKEEPESTAAYKNGTA